MRVQRRRLKGEDSEPNNLYGCGGAVFCFYGSFICLNAAGRNGEFEMGDYLGGTLVGGKVGSVGDERQW